MPRPKGSGTNAEHRIAEEVARVVGAGRAVAVETVGFSDPNRPKLGEERSLAALGRRDSGQHRRPG